MLDSNPLDTILHIFASVLLKKGFSKLNRAKKGENWHHLGDLGYNFSEWSTPPSHIYDTEVQIFSDAQLTEIIS